MNFDSTSLRVTETHVGWGVLLLSIGVLTVCGALVVALDANTTATQAEFKRLSQSVSTGISRRLLLPTYGLAGARGAIAAKGTLPNVEEFRRYVAARNLPSEIPGITGIGLIVRIERENLADLEQDVSDQYGNRFSVRTSGEKPDLYVIRSIEPRGVNAPALGFDVGSEASRRAAVERSYRIGMPSATAPIRLLQDPQQRLATLYLLPVFASGGPTRASEDDQVIGLVYAAMTYELLLNDAVFRYSDSVAVALRDLEAPAGDQLIAGTLEPVRPNAALIDVKRIVYGGRSLELTLASTKAFETEKMPWAAWIAALAGFIASVLGAILVVQLSATRSRARAMAKAMTADLHRFEVMAERSSSAAMVLDSSGKATWVNAAMLDISGADKEQLIGRQALDVLMAEHSDIDALSQMRRSLALKKSFDGTLILTTPDERQIEASARILPTFDRRETCTGFIVFVSPGSTG